VTLVDLTAAISKSGHPVQASVASVIRAELALRTTWSYAAEEWTYEDPAAHGRRRCRKTSRAAKPVAPLNKLSVRAPMAVDIRYQRSLRSPL
jgi:hypothetical protein